MKKIAFLLFFCLSCLLILLTRDFPGAFIKELPRSGAMRALDFMASQRAYPNPVIPANAFYRAYEEDLLMKKSGENLQAPDTWEKIGPYNQGGRTIALAVNPQKPDIVYAGSASGGLWRLTLSGSNYQWEYLDTGFPVLGVNAIAIDPSDPDIMYIGTGEVYGYQNSNGGLYDRTTRGSYGIGLLKTTDGGSTWTKSIDWSYQQQRGILCIRLNPGDPDILFAGTTEGTYKSRDRGDTWEKVHDGLMAVDIAINPLDTQTVFVSCGNFSSSGTGLYRSVNGGNTGTWTRLGNGLPSTWSGKTLLSVFRDSPDILFADVANDFNTIGLYKSTNSGDSWTKISSVDFARYQGWFAHYVRVHPENDSKIMCAGVDFYRTTNGGGYWTHYTENAMHVDHHCFADHPTDPDIVYFGNDGGVYRTTDGGQTFQSLNQGYITTQFYNGFASSATHPNIAMGGLQDNNTIVYTGSVNWTQVLFGDGAYCAIDPTNPYIMYASYQNLNIYRTTQGHTGYWKPVSGSLYGTACFVAPYRLSPSEPAILYAGSTYLFRSNDRGDSWIPLNGTKPINGSPVLSIAVSHSNSNRVYTATVPTSYKRGEVFRTDNGGLSWFNITGSLPDRYYVDLETDPQNDDIAYITLSGFGTSHLYRTADAGQSWEDIGQGLPDVPTSAVIIDPEETSHLYAGNDLGVYVSTDDGNTWSKLDDNVPAAMLVMDLSISPSDRKIRAVTHGNGVYERTLLSKTGVKDRDDPVRTATFRLDQNYPNPFNPDTQIRFSLSEKHYITLRIYNITGEEIRRLNEGYYSQGEHVISWDGRDHSGNLAPSGTYLYRISAGELTETRRMILLR